MIDDWITALTAELGLDEEVDVTAVLDLARDVAHDVARPAAPVTAFVVGLVAGRAGGSADEVTRAIEVARRLARGWTPTDPE